MKHKYIVVNTDEMRRMDAEEGFDGYLADLAALRLSQWQEMEGSIRIVNVESSTWDDEIRPVTCNSDTWYTRTSMKLSIWYEEGPEKNPRIIDGAYMDSIFMGTEGLTKYDVLISCEAVVSVWAAAPGYAAAVVEKAIKQDLAGCVQVGRFSVGTVTENV